MKADVYFLSPVKTRNNWLATDEKWNMSEKLDTSMSQRETEDEGQFLILLQQSKNTAMTWAEVR